MKANLASTGSLELKARASDVVRPEALRQLLAHFDLLNVEPGQVLLPELELALLWGLHPQVVQLQLVSPLLIDVDTPACEDHEVISPGVIIVNGLKGEADWPDEVSELNATVGLGKTHVKVDSAGAVQGVT